MNTKNEQNKHRDYIVKCTDGTWFLSAGHDAQEIYDLWKPQEHLIGDGTKVVKSVYLYVNKDLAAKKFVRRTDNRTDNRTEKVQKAQFEPSAKRRRVNIPPSGTSSPYCSVTETISPRQCRVERLIVKVLTTPCV